jgi:phytoene desaturase
LRTLFSRFATYLGASPYSARAYLNVISHVELTAGLWYPKGGTVQIARAYQRLAEELGVEVRTGVRVTQILVENGTAQGVQTADGSTVHGDAVIADVDATTVYYNLIPSLRGSKRLKRWITKPFSCSGFVMLLGIDKQHPQLMHHNILFSDDYATEFDAIFRRGIPLKDPTVYIAITSKTDPGHAPPSSENWFVMTNVPPLGPGWNWEQDLDRYRSLVLERLARFGFDVRGHIQTERMITPVDIERLTGAWRGALYGHSFNPPFAPFLRPHNRCPDVRSLYFAGGTTHPGGGVPLVTLSGKTAARMAIRDGIS